MISIKFRLATGIPVRFRYHSNVFGKIIQVSQIEHRQPGIPSKFSNFRKFLNDSQLCKGKLPLLRCTFLNALTSQYRNFPYRPSFKLKLAALMADFVWPTCRRKRRHQAQMQGLLCVGLSCAACCSQRVLRRAWRHPYVLNDSITVKTLFTGKYAQDVAKP